MRLSALLLSLMMRFNSTLGLLKDPNPKMTLKVTLAGSSTTNLKLYTKARSAPLTPTLV
jgi:hypothetical protein